MTLEEFVEKVKIENNIKHKTLDILKFINDKANKKLNNKPGAIDDETIKDWILKFNPNKTDEDDDSNLVIEPKKKVVGTKDKDKVEGSWGSQTSLF